MRSRKWCAGRRNAGDAGNAGNAGRGVWGSTDKVQGVFCCDPSFEQIRDHSHYIHRGSLRRW